MNKALILISTLAIAAVTLVGCGGGGGSSAPVAVTPPTVTLAASPAITAAVANTTFTFPAGVPSFGTTAPTTVSFTNTATTPAFSIASGTHTATGVTTFGSCHFKILSSDFPAPPPLPDMRAGQEITVENCNLVVNTGQQQADGTAQNKSMMMFLGTQSSTSSPITVGVNPGGELVLNGKSSGYTVTLQFITGT